MLQSLIAQFEGIPRYWSQNNPPYEVDFLIQRENDIFPVEVKSETNIASRSLKKFKELFSDKARLRVRFSLNNLKLDGGLLNIPLLYGGPRRPPDRDGAGSAQRFVGGGDPG